MLSEVGKTHTASVVPVTDCLLDVGADETIVMDLR